MEMLCHLRMTCPVNQHSTNNRDDSPKIHKRVDLLVRKRTAVDFLQKRYPRVPSVGYHCRGNLETGQPLLQNEEERF